MTTKRDWDVKLTQGGTPHKLRLLQQENRKAWKVSELPPTPQIESAASSRAGFNPDRELPFVMEDWYWGVGLERFGSQSDRGHVLRYSEGFGIDTTEPGVARHGPLLETQGATGVGENILGFILFQNKVYLRSSQKLFAIESGAPVEKIDFGGGITTSMAIFGNKLYIATGISGKYSEWDGSSHTEYTVTDGADRFISVQGANTPLLVRIINGNFISTAIDPTDPTSSTVGFGSPGVQVGDGDAITQLFTVSGFLFAGTTSSLYLIATDVDGVSTPIEMDKRLTTRRSVNSWAVKAESGSDVWLSDTDQTVYRLSAQGFEEFDIQPGGPFRSFDVRPVTLPEGFVMQGVVAMAQDLDAVYVMALVDSALVIYKGKEIIRDVFNWCPWAKYALSLAPTSCEVIKLTGDTDPYLYFADGINVKRYRTRGWTTFAATWEMITPQFTATLETWDKMWTEMSAFLIITGTAKIEIAYRLNNTAGWTDFDDAVAGTNDMTATGFNQLKLAAPIAGKKIQLRIRGSNSSSGDKVDLRSFNLTGILRPERKPIFDFTVIADTGTESTFLNALRTNATQFFTITDRFDVDRTAFVLPGFPIEEELYDEAIKAPVRTYRIVAQEVV